MRKDFCGLLGKTILGMDFAWLLYMMPEFVKTKLCPCLENEDGLWEGLLPHLQISIQTQEVLMPYMRKRIAEKTPFCNDNIQTNFIKTFTTILWYFCDKEPLLNVEFPALYNYLQISQCKIVVNIAKDILRHNSEDFNKEF